MEVMSARVARARLRSMTKSDNQLWDKRELVFGRVPAGETRSWTIPVKIPKDTRSRFDLIKFQFFEGSRELPQARQYHTLEFRRRFPDSIWLT